MILDMTHGSPAKLMLRFSVPLLIGNVFQQLYNFADAAIVGKTLGYKALAAVGSTGAVMFLIFGFYFGLTGGLSVVTGQRFGANDPEGVRKSVAASVIISSVLTLITTVLCTVFTPLILRWMNTPDDIMKDAYDYMFIMLAGTWALVFYGLLSSILRALGDTITPVVFLVVSCFLNIGLDFMFILVFPWGVAGAAWATVVSQAISGFLCLRYVALKFPILRMHWCNWNVCRAFYMEHLRVSLPMAFQFTITAMGVVVLQAVLNDFGSIFIAASTVAGRLDSIAISPMFSFGMAMAAYAAQNYGARNVERIRQGIRACSAIALVFITIVGILVMVYASSIACLFMDTYNEEVVKGAKTMITICCSFYWILTMLLIYRNVLQGMGHSIIPMLAGVVELFLRIFAALVFAKYWGFTGVCFAHPLAWVGATVVLFADYMIVMRRLIRDGLPSMDHLVRRTEADYLKECSAK